jgi:hypothetical protein
MTPEVFAEWFRLQGIRVVRTSSSYWARQGLGAYQAFPYHWLITPSSEEMRECLRKTKAIALRYSTPLDSPEGRLSYHAVYEGHSYGLENLTSKSRHNVRRGLNRCRVESISLTQLAAKGWALQQDTLNRQRRSGAMTQSSWRRMIEGAADLPGFEAWGSFIGATLAASVLTFQMDDTIYMLYQQCLREYTNQYVNNALAFVVTQNVLGRSHVKRVLYGLDSLDAPPSTNEFKFRMGYEARPVKQRVVFHPIVAPLVGGVAHGALRLMRRICHSCTIPAKAEGIVTFYREGKKPWQEQHIPGILLNTHKISIP